eukprot:5822732-Pyramimonas_sp.AAC.1
MLPAGYIFFEKIGKEAFSGLRKSFLSVADSEVLDALNRILMQNKPCPVLQRAMDALGKL